MILHPQLKLTLVKPDGSTVHVARSARQLVATSFVPGAQDAQLPTLVTVEQVNHVLAGMTMALADQRQTTKLAVEVSREFLTRPPERWRDLHIELLVENHAAAPVAEEIVGGIDDLRVPTLRMAEEQLGYQRPEQRREAEILLVDELVAQVERQPDVWERYPMLVSKFLGRTLSTRSSASWWACRCCT